MRKTRLLAAVVAWMLGMPLLAQGPFLEPAGVEDLGAGSYRYHYIVNHAVDPYVNKDITDVHVEGPYEWQPGTVTVEGPGGWTGDYDGVFYHWRLTGSGDPVVHGSIESGFTVNLATVGVDLVLVDSPVQWTEDPFDDQSVFATSTAPLPVPAPRLVQDGVEDLGGGNYRYHYAVDHSDDGFVNKDITDVHVEGHYQWQPGTVTVEGPGGWTGDYDGVFYHWRLTGSGDPVVHGSIESGFTVNLATVGVDLMLVDSPVQWTEDPFDDQSVFATSTAPLPVPAPRLVQDGVEDLGGGNYRYHYAVDHSDDGFVNKDITDVHVEGHYQWQPGTVTVEGPGGWTGDYDGVFYHWRLTGSGDPVVHGSIESGFTVNLATVGVDLVLVDSPVQWTEDPFDDQSVFATSTAPLPVPAPRLVQDGVEDLGGGNYRYHYAVDHSDDGFVNKDITDVHVEGHYQWQPGTVTVEGPGGWTGDYDGVFYHWRLTGSGDPVVHGSIESGFTVNLVTVGVDLVLVDSPVQWTEDPLDDQSVFATSTAPLPVPAPRLVQDGVEDLGGGNYRYHYAVDHSDDGFVNKDITDVHVEGPYEWQPGTVTVEGPSGWTGDYDGVFYHWRLTGSGDPVVHGSIESGFTVNLVTVGVDLVLVDSPVQWTEDPFDDQSVFATSTAPLPVPAPRLVQDGVEDLGGGNYRYHYAVDHSDDGFVNKDITDVHVEGPYEWQPGTVTVEGPGGWTGDYDGEFYHWRLTGSGDPVVHGSIESGFTVNLVTVGVDLVLVDSPVQWTEDPFDDQSVFATSTAPLPVPAPRFVQDGVEDLGGGNYRYHYAVDHSDDGFVNKDITDVHVEGPYEWQPGTVTVEGPGGWTGDYDGEFYHWRLTGSGDPVVHGSIESGFTVNLVTVGVDLVLVDSPVQWTEDPFDDQSVFATSTAPLPVPAPRLVQDGVEDLGGGNYRYHYAVDHSDDGFVNKDITDVHVEGPYEWQPGTVTVEGPSGWTGDYDGEFYHWRLTGSGDPVVHGSIESGFTVNLVTVGVDLVLVDSPVQWTEDPFDDQSVFATSTAPLPVPAPRFVQDGVEDLGGGNYRYHYAVDHSDDGFVNKDITDVHVEGHYQWQPGTVIVEGPNGWSGEYDGAFYHWRLTGSGQPVVHGSVQSGFSVELISIGVEPVLVDSPVQWTTDPLDDSSVFAVSTTAMPVLGPRLDYLGHEDLGGGHFRHDYAVNHTGNALVDEEITDVHVDGRYRWEPGSVTVEGPFGWEGEYDGRFYHWRMSGTGAPVAYGSIETGFSINTTSITTTPILVTNVPVQFTNDPLVADSVFAETLTNVPRPDPWATCRLPERALNRQSLGSVVGLHVLPEPPYGTGDVAGPPFELRVEESGPLFEVGRSILDDRTMRVEFDRADLQVLAPLGDAVELTVSGVMHDGLDFDGTGHIHVIDEGGLHLYEDDPSTILDDAIRGEIDLLGPAGDLGPVVCLPFYLSNFTFSLNTDPQTPAEGQVFFYLYRFCGGTPTCTYGQSSQGPERVPSSGDCP